MQSFLRHSRLAQASVINCFEQGADFRHTPICDGLQASDARKTIVAARPAGFGEFGGGAVRVAFDPITAVRPRRSIPGVISAMAPLVVLLGARHAAAGSCENLMALVLPDTMIAIAQQIPAGTYTAPDGEVFHKMPAFCRIAATLTPTPGSNIRIEVWMPSSGWNGRYNGTGNSGIGGKIVYSWLAAVQANYAVANTDVGTSPAATHPADGIVLTDHPERQIDYATRSTHLMTVRAKQIIKAFYGEPPKYSYFTGCSSGGAQGVHEALQSADSGRSRDRGGTARLDPEQTLLAWAVQPESERHA